MNHAQTAPDFIASRPSHDSARAPVKPASSFFKRAIRDGLKPQSADGKVPVLSSSTIARMAKDKTTYTCTECGGTSPKWLGKCPHCNAWNTLVEIAKAWGPLRRSVFVMSGH